MLISFLTWPGVEDRECGACGCGPWYVRILLWRRLLPDPLHLPGQQQEMLPALHVAGEALALFLHLWSYNCPDSGFIGISQQYMMKMNFSNASGSKCNTRWAGCLGVSGRQFGSAVWGRACSSQSSNGQRTKTLHDHLQGENGHLWGTSVELSSISASFTGSSAW